MRRKYSFRFTSLLPTLTVFFRFVGLSIFVVCTICQYVNGIFSSFVTYCFTSDFTVFQSLLCKKRSEPAFASAEICQTSNFAHTRAFTPSNILFQKTLFGLDKLKLA